MWPIYNLQFTCIIKRTLRCKRDVSVICGLIGQFLKHKGHIPTRWFGFFSLCYSLLSWFSCFWVWSFLFLTILLYFDSFFCTLTFTLTHYINKAACLHFKKKEKHFNVQKQLLCQNPTEPLFGQYGIKKIAKFLNNSKKEPIYKQITCKNACGLFIKSQHLTFL